MTLIDTYIIAKFTTFGKRLMVATYTNGLILYPSC